MEFPAGVVGLLACPGCGNQLRPRGEAAACRGCGAAYPVTEGILRMLNATEVDQASAEEMTLRDGDAEAAFEAERSAEERAAATALTLRALGEGPSGGALLELGCGSGHYTSHLIGRFDPIVAVDFSLKALQRFAARMPPGANVALVHADITKFAVQPGSFTRCLSTLVSNLPSWAHREAMYRLAVTALAPDGLFVFGAHYHDAHNRLRGAPKAYNYNGDGIFCQAFTRRDIRRELTPHFTNVDVSRVEVQFRGLGRLDRLLAPRLGTGAVQVLAAKVPLVNLMAKMLLVSAQPARRSAGEPQTARRPTTASYSR